MQDRKPRTSAVIDILSNLIMPPRNPLGPISPFKWGFFYNSTSFRAGCSNLKRDYKDSNQAQHLANHCNPKKPNLTIVVPNKPELAPTRSLSPSMGLFSPSPRLSPEPLKAATLGLVAQVSHQLKNCSNNNLKSKKKIRLLLAAFQYLDSGSQQDLQELVALKNAYIKAYSYFSSKHPTLKVINTVIQCKFHKATLKEVLKYKLTILEGLKAAYSKSPIDPLREEALIIQRALIIAALQYLVLGESPRPLGPMDGPLSTQSIFKPRLKELEGLQHSLKACISEDDFVQDQVKSMGERLTSFIDEHILTAKDAFFPELGFPNSWDELYLSNSDSETDSSPVV